MTSLQGPQENIEESYRSSLLPSLNLSLHSALSMDRDKESTVWLRDLWDELLAKFRDRYGKKRLEKIPVCVFGYPMALTLLIVGILEDDIELCHEAERLQTRYSKEIEELHKFVTGRMNKVAPYVT